MRINIRVGKKNIERASRKNSHTCMIADAIQEQIPNAKYILVDAQSIRFTIKGKRHILLTPPNAQRELINFDNGKNPQPFTVSASRGFTRLVRKEKRRQNTHPRNHKKVSNKPKKISVTREFGLRQIID